MEFVFGAASSAGAVLFTNPLDVLKTKAQLQGELRARGQYTVHYKNMFHAVYLISKEEGILALQKGLAPAMLFQISLNGFRLGLFQIAENHGLTRKADGSVSAPRAMFCGALTGVVGSVFSSPFQLVKTQIQSQAPVAVSKGKNIALGEQHVHTGTWNGLVSIYQKAGIPGLWVGTTAAATRIAVGSCVQLSTFTICKEFIESTEYFEKDAVWEKTFVSSMLVGVAASIVMTPFDLVSTRLYNQRRDASGQGLMYKGIMDCFLKSLRSEGIHGLYKGFVPVCTRIAPHSVLSLMFWEKLKDLYQHYSEES